MLDGFNTQQQQRRRYPRAENDVFGAIVALANREFNVTSTDPLTRTVTFSSHESAWTWGENVTVMVFPAEGGCDVEISGVGKVGGQVQQATALIETFNAFFESLSSELSGPPSP